MAENGFNLTIHRANCCGNDKNCVYQYPLTITTEEDFREAVKYDHVYFDFHNNYRSIKNFKVTSVAVPDCDNDHSDNERDWITPERLTEAFPDVRYILYTSRHHMKQKGTRSPRPRFHVVFFTDPITDAKEYTALLERLQKFFPYFDIKAFDAGRFFFGNADSEVIFHPGNTTLTEFLEVQEFAALDDIIPEGCRNNTLIKRAVCILKRYGDCEESYQAYLKESERCVPLLPDDEVENIWKSGRKCYAKIMANPNYIPPEKYNAPQEVQWDEPIPFDECRLPPFPVDALPPPISRYVTALAESTQTPVDMAASSSIPILSVCLQGKYKIQPKADWSEPLNTYLLNIMEPSERKSAVANAMVRPLNRYETEINVRNAGQIEASRMHRRILEKRQKALEDQAAKGKADQADLDRIAAELAEYREKSPLRLYVDDITTEKLTSVLADNGGKASILSTEGGIFDTLSGIYTKNVNIDVMLKGYSGDSIRVDRIGRNSESIMNPALTVLLMVQPNVLSGMMQNGTFRGRGLTARFLYCMPQSSVGTRRYRSEQVPEEVYHDYESLLRNLLEDEYPPEPEVISLSYEADEKIAAFADELEPKLRKEYADIADWAGKLTGNILRIAGLLCRASVYRSHDFLDDPEPLVVDGQTMDNVIRIGRYFIEHAKAAFSLMGADTAVKQSKYVLSAIQTAKLTEFSRRDIMRLCRSFRKTEELQPILDHLADYGYIAVKDAAGYTGKGRPPAQAYLVNPCLYNHD